MEGMPEFVNGQQSEKRAHGKFSGWAGIGVLYLFGQSLRHVVQGWDEALPEFIVLGGHDQGLIVIVRHAIDREIGMVRPILPGQLQQAHRRRKAELIPIIGQHPITALGHFPGNRLGALTMEGLDPLVCQDEQALGGLGA